MKKCDYIGCKAKAVVFGKEKAYCLNHAKELGLVEQTNLLDYGFPDIKNRLKLGGK
jgi:phage anti-repressor protein